MSLIQEVDKELNKVIKQIEQLLIKELNTDSDNLCFYNEDIRVNYINSDSLKYYFSVSDILTIAPVPTSRNTLDMLDVVPIGENTLGYSILLEHIPTGMLINYYIYDIDTEDYPNFKYIDNEKTHRILRVFKDNFTKDYIFLENNPELFNLLDNLTFKALMYQNFKELLEKENEN